MPRAAVIHCTSPGAEIAAVAEVILMAHVAVEHVGDGFEAAMRMRRETCDVVVRVIGIELVEHQERIHVHVRAGCPGCGAA